MSSSPLPSSFFHSSSLLTHSLALYFLRSACLFLLLCHLLSSIANDKQIDCPRGWRVLPRSDTRQEIQMGYIQDEVPLFFSRLPIPHYHSHYYHHSRHPSSSPIIYHISFAHIHYSDDEKQLIVDQYGAADSSYNSLLASLPTQHPRWVLINFEYRTARGPSSKVNTSLLTSSPLPI